jgi:hypothetical protein
VTLAITHRFPRRGSRVYAVFNALSGLSWPGALEVGSWKVSLGHVVTQSKCPFPSVKLWSPVPESRATRKQHGAEKTTLVAVRVRRRYRKLGRHLSGLGSRKARLTRSTIEGVCRRLEVKGPSSLLLSSINRRRRSKRHGKRRSWRSQPGRPGPVTWPSKRMIIRLRKHLRTTARLPAAQSHTARTRGGRGDLYC